MINYSKVIKGPKNTPWAVEASLRWTCASKTSITADEQNPVCKTQINSHPHLDNELFKKVQQWKKIESCHIALSKKAVSKNDEKALQIHESPTKCSDGHYEIGLLWKLPNNRLLAEKQLIHLNKKLSTKPDLQKSMRRRSRKIFKMVMLSKLIQLETKKPHVLIFFIIPFQMKTNTEKSKESRMHPVFFKVNP